MDEGVEEEKRNVIEGTSRNPALTRSLAPVAHLVQQLSSLQVPAARTHSTENLLRLSLLYSITQLALAAASNEALDPWRAAQLSADLASRDPPHTSYELGAYELPTNQTSDRLLGEPENSRNLLDRKAMGNQRYDQRLCSEPGK